MTNTLITPTIIAKEALMHLDNELVMAKKVNKSYKKEFGVKPGSTITLRKPVKFRTKVATTMDSVNVYETSDTLAVATQAHVAWNFTSQELTHTVEEYSQRYIKPAMITLANTIDTYLMNLYQDVYNEVGTPGTTPTTYAGIGLAARRLDEEACPQSERTLVLDPTTAWSVAGILTSVYNPGMVAGAIQRGEVTRFAGMDILMDQNIPAHTVGAHSGTPLVNGTPSEGATTLATDGWTASTAVLTDGDIFTIANVYAVNPITGAKLDHLRQFVVTSAATSSSAGAATLSISPAIYSSAATEDYLPYQTVDTLPANNAAIVVRGTASTAYRKNIAFHKDAFGLVTLPLDLPDGATFKAREEYKGLSVRVVKDYDITNDTDRIRLDILFGVKTLRPELAVRLTR